MLLELWSIVSVMLGLAMCCVVMYFLFAGRHDRDREEEAREYFDVHGHWPDEA